MNDLTPAQTIREIIARTPQPPAPARSGYGQWVRPAWVVRGLVARGWGVSDAVRETVAAMGLEGDRAFRGVRACYYAIRTEPWPDDMREVVP